MKRYIIILIYLFSINCFSQSDPVLVRINNDEFTRSEFEYYYSKHKENGPNAIISPEEYIKEFVNNKLKIAEAKSEGLDTNISLQSELNNYHRQLARQYISQETDNQPTEQEILTPTGRNVLIEGYHIFKYLPQNTPVHEVNRVNARFDSLYTAIIRDSSLDFIELVEKYSDDKNLFTVTSLDIPEEFEKEVFSTQTDGISKPFFTPQGIHIVKILRRHDSALLSQGEYLRREQVRKNKFNKSHHTTPLDKIKKEYNFIPNKAALSELASTGKTQNILFTIDNRPYTMTEFALFSQDNPRGRKTQIEEFIAKSLYDYQLSQLNINNPEMNLQLTWYREKSLLNQINNLKIGDAQNNNIKSLQTYFNAHKKDYYWDLPRYRGIVVHCDSKRTGKKIKKQLKKIPQTQWVDFLNNNYNLSSQPKIIIEEGTYAVGQNDFVDKLVFKVGKFTPIKSHPFTIVMGEKIKGPESFEEISDIVAADYRNSLESSWIERLRKKSKVEINQEVLKTVNNQ